MTLSTSVLAVLLYAQIAVSRIAAHPPRSRAAGLLEGLFVVVSEERRPRDAVH